jgi:clan AA aspartic protease (TIGR02281 family)
MNYRTILVATAIVTATIPAFAAEKWWGIKANTNTCLVTGFSPTDIIRYYHGKIVGHSDGDGVDIEVPMGRGKKHVLTLYHNKSDCEQGFAATTTAPAPATATTPTVATASAADQKLEPATATDVKEIYIAADRLGGFSTSVTINGITELGAIDTGADRVSLTAETATRLGLHLLDKDYIDRYSTANGVAYSAPVTLDRLQIGSFVFDNVPAEVAKPGAQDTNLIGMSLLKDLRLELRHGTMVLSRDS